MLARLYPTYRVRSRSRNCALLRGHDSLHFLERWIVSLDFLPYPILLARSASQTDSNSIPSPVRMIAADATNQGYVFHWNWGTSGLAGTPAPIAKPRRCQAITVAG